MVPRRAALLLFLAVTCRTGCALAFARAPARWEPGATIPVWIEAPNVPAWQRDMVRRALATWSDAAGGAFRFQEVGEFPSRGIRIRFVRGDENFGEAMPYLDDRTGAIVKADVVLSIDAPGDELQKRLVLYLTALHEVGHALGLGHSDDFRTIMYRFRGPADPPRYFLGYRKKLGTVEDIGRGAATGLADADRAELRRLYGP